MTLKKIEKIPPPQKKNKNKNNKAKNTHQKKYLRNIDAFTYRKKV